MITYELERLLTINNYNDLLIEFYLLDKKDLYKPYTQRIYKNPPDYAKED